MKAFLTSLFPRLDSRFGRSERSLLVLAAVLLPLVSAPSFAGSGGLGAPGEGVGSLPSGISLPAGLVLLGDFEAVLGMIEDVTPTGDVRVLPLDPSDPLGLVAVVFSGNLDVRLDRSQLLASQATFLFSPGEALVGASGQARFDGRLGLPFVVQGNVPLPYASAFTASGAHLYGFQASGGESMARIVASSSASDVVVRLRSR